MVDVETAPFADLLRQYRLAARLTQEELAERAELSARTISDLERGVKRHPFPHTTRQLVEALSLGGTEAAALLRAAKRGEEPHEGASKPLLPVQPTSFIGRRQEVEEVTALLLRDDIQLLTLTGPGGVGKTRLALRVAEEMAHRFADGAVFVELAALADPALVPGAIARSLGMRVSTEHPILEQLIEHFRGEQQLLVLDNLEHLLSAADGLSRLLAACRHLTVLVTARAPLHLAAEHEYPVPPLTLPTPQHLPEPGVLLRYDSVQLFIHRSQGVRPGFDLTGDNASAIAEICRRLDGLPLAIELAAARIRLFPVRVLLDRLADRLGLLVGGPRDAPVRLQTLRNTLDWSYQLLTSDQQRLFARLSVFSGGCTLDAAAAVCGVEAGADPLEALASLVDQNLLRQVGEEDLRFSMLETVREYAVARLEERGQTSQARAAHATYYLEMAQQAEPGLMGLGQAGWLSRLETEHDNLRAGLRSLLNTGQPVAALRLATALERFWHLRGYAREGAAWLDEALEAAGTASVPERARGLVSCAELLWDCVELGSSEAHVREALDLYRELGDQGQIAFALFTLGNIALIQGHLIQAESLHQEGLGIAQQTGVQLNVALDLGNLGLVAHAAGDGRRAAAALTEAVQILEDLGAQAYAAYYRACLGRALRELGDLDGAEMAAQGALDLGRQIGAQHAIYAGLLSLAELAMARGGYEQAAALCDEMLVELRASGSPSYFAAIALAKLAEATNGLGDDDRARRSLAEAVRLTRRSGSHTFLPHCLETVAWLLARQGDLARSARLAGGATAVREAQGGQAFPSERATNEQRLAAARSQLGESAWLAHWREGQGLSSEELLDIALEALTAAHPPDASRQSKSSND